MHVSSATWFKAEETCTTLRGRQCYHVLLRQGIERNLPRSHADGIVIAGNGSPAPSVPQPLGPNSHRIQGDQTMDTMCATSELFCINFALRSREHGGKRGDAASCQRRTSLTRVPRVTRSPRDVALQRSERRAALRARASEQHCQPFWREGEAWRPWRARSHGRHWRQRHRRDRSQTHTHTHTHTYRLALRRASSSYTQRELRSVVLRVRSRTSVAWAGVGAHHRRMHRRHRQHTLDTRVHVLRPKSSSSL